ncbi:hypothetical protein STEG23_011192, partial [Scotinomys teguina]
VSFVKDVSVIKQHAYERSGCIPVSARNSMGVEVERLEEPEKQEVCCEVVSPISGKKVTPLIMQQYGCPNKNGTMTVSLHVLTQKGEFTVGPPLDKELKVDGDF